jgi:hypothetical protein
MKVWVFLAVYYVILFLIILVIDLRWKFISFQKEKKERFNIPFVIKRSIEF